MLKNENLLKLHTSALLPAHPWGSSLWPSEASTLDGSTHPTAAIPSQIFYIAYSVWPNYPSLGQMNPPAKLVASLLCKVPGGSVGTGGHQVFHPELVDLFRMVLYKNGCINYINVVFMCRFTWEQGGLTLPWRSLWGLGSGWPDWSVFRLSRWSGWPDWSVFRLSRALLGSEAEVYMRVLLFQPPKEAFQLIQNSPRNALSLDCLYLLKSIISILYCFCMYFLVFIFYIIFIYIAILFLFKYIFIYFLLSFSIKHTTHI